MPRVFQPDAEQQIFYALGYGGNGVTYSAQASKRMAEQIAGKKAEPDLPIFASPLPGHPLALFRRLSQRLLYRYHYRKDEIL